MSDRLEGSEVVTQLVDEFALRWREGERPTIEEFTGRHPELADEIREILPPLERMVSAAPRNGDVSRGGGAQSAESSAARAADAAATPERLGDYRIIREVGRGGAGVVYEAQQESLQRRVALKVLRVEKSRDAETLDRFQHEARSAAQLHHTNIVPVFEVGQDGARCFYAMQFIEGQSLDEVVEDLVHLRSRMKATERAETGSSNGTVGSLCQERSALDDSTVTLYGGDSLPQVLAASDSKETHAGGNGQAEEERPIRVKRGNAGMRSALTLLPKDMGTQPSEACCRYFCRSVARLGEQVAEALAYAHARGVVHRDVKPSNLLLDLEGMVWVADFGLAKTEADDLTRKDSLVGTIRYMSPERFRGECDERADVYGLGVTLYELLTLRPAFDARKPMRLIEQVSNQQPPSPRTIAPHIPVDLEAIVLKAMDKDLEGRYASAEALREDLHCFLEDRPIRARRVGPAERLFRSVRRNTGIAALAATVVLLLVAGMCGALLVAAHSKQAEGRQRQLAEKNWHLANAKRSALDAAIAAGHKTEVALKREALSRREAQDQRAISRQNFYYAQMNVAHHAFDSHRGTPQLREFLANWRPVNGQPELRGWEWYYLHSLPHRELLVLGVHGGAIRRVAWSDNGQWLAVADMRHTATVWDAASGMLVARLEGHTGPVVSVSFSRDGRWLASASADGTVRVWDVTTWQTARILAGDGGRVDAVACSPDGRRLAAAVADAKVTIWDIEEGTLLGALPSGAGKVLDLSWSPDGRRLAAACDKAEVIVWDTESCSRLHNLQHEETVRSIAWSPDGTQLAAALYGPRSHSRIEIWNITSGDHRATLRGHTHWATAVAWSPDGTRLASSSLDHTVLIWDAASGTPLHTVRGHIEEVMTVCWDPTGKRIASAGKGRTVRISDAGDPQRVVTLRAEVESNSPRRASVAWSPRGDRIATGMGGDGKSIQIWSAETHAEELMLRGHGAAVEAVAWSPDGGRLASSDYGGTLIIWDTATGAEVAKLGGHEGPVYSVAWSPDGTYLASAGRDGTVRIWDVQTAAEIRVLRGHKPGPGGAYGGVTCVAWHPNGKSLASAGADSTIKIWDPCSDQPLRTLHASSRFVICLAWSPDGKRLATAGADKRLRIWDVAKGRLSRTCRGHTDWIFSVDWHPDGSRLASSSAAGNVAIWDAHTGRLALGLQSGLASVKQVSWSPDGLRLAVAREDGVVEVRDATLGYQLERSAKLLPWLDARIGAGPQRRRDLQLHAAIHGRLCNWNLAVADFERLSALDAANAPHWFEADWWLVGPYPDDLKAKYPPEAAVDPFLPLAAEPEDERRTGPYQWQPARAEPGGLVDLGTYFGNAEHISAYALLPVYATQRCKVAVLLGSDDGVRLWCNGHLVHEHDIMRTAVADQDVVVVTLDAGWNRLLAKVVNAGKGHALILRLSDDPADMERGGRRKREPRISQMTRMKKRRKGEPTDDRAGPRMTKKETKEGRTKKVNRSRVNKEKTANER